MGKVGLMPSYLVPYKAPSACSAWEAHTNGVMRSGVHLVKRKGGY